MWACASISAIDTAFTPLLALRVARLCGVPLRPLLGCFRLGLFVLAMAALWVIAPRALCQADLAQVREQPHEASVLAPRPRQVEPRMPLGPQRVPASLLPC